MKVLAEAKALNWKVCLISFFAGGLVSYNETALEAYSLISDINHKSMNASKLEIAAQKLQIFRDISQDQSWQKLRSWEGLDRLVVSRGNSERVKGSDVNRSLTNTTLAKTGGILIEPTIFHNADRNSTVTVVHVGDKLCGYPLLVHGGILATILNETFKRNVSLSGLSSSNVKDDFMVDQLGISYKAPSLANQFMIIKTQLLSHSDVDGRFASQSTIETKDGKVLVEGSATIVETGRASRIQAESEAKKWIVF